MSLPILRLLRNQILIKMGDVPIKSPPVDAPFPLTDVDNWVLSLTDDEFTYHDWEDLIISENNLSVLKRKPSDLRRYMKWTAEIKTEIPFSDASDYRVLKNDWPYGLTSDITHIVVWSRTIIETDSVNGDMTPESRRTVAEFIKRFFIDRLGQEGDKRVCWFKNWVALQSVRSLEHIHVMVKDASDVLIDEFTRELECHA
ncbi:hypothetical protein GGR57DRAFT_3883 [Xylariaceae sp. FL1272]|nr:hypothetical protein GGR57DRAFT_3883 [Xylariaceae sp. FL1272]